MNLMLDVPALGIFGSKKFSARRQIKKKGAHFDLRSRGFTAIAHNVELAAVNDDFRPRECVRRTRRQAKSRHTGDAWQRFAPKSECSDSFKIRSSPNLAGGMPLQRKQGIIAVHAAAVIDYANQ